MIATIIPFKLRAGVAPSPPSVSPKTEAERLAVIQARLELQREQLLTLIEGLRASPAAGMNNDLGVATANLNSAASFALVQVELMLRRAQGLDVTVRAQH